MVWFDKMQTPLCRRDLFSNLLVPLLLSSFPLHILATPPSQYYPYNPDNLFPLFADPTHNVSCVGMADELGEELPIRNGFDPNAISMNDLCVKPQYGGGRPGRHLGAYCQPYDPVPVGVPHRAVYGKVAFDPNPSAFTAKWLRNPRLLLHCRSRCFCNYNVLYADRERQPKEVPAEYRTEVRRGNAYRIEIDVIDDHENAAVDITAILDHWTADHIARRITSVIDGTSEVAPVVVGMDLPPMPISISRANLIECDGDLPDWPLPEPFSRSDFTDLKHLCAVQLAGGNP